MCGDYLTDAVEVGADWLVPKVPWGGAPEMKNGNCVFTVLVWGQQDQDDPTKEKTAPFHVRDAVECYALTLQPPLRYPETCVRCGLAVGFIILCVPN